MTEPAWAIVRSRTRCEDIVERGLRDAGYRTYVPRFRTLTWPHGTQRKPAATMRALFSGLVFVQDWRGWPKEPISQVIGLMLSPRPGIPCALSGTDIALLMERERLGIYEPHHPRPPANGIVMAHVDIGDAVEFDLAGQAISGILDELSPNGSALIRAAILGRDVQIRVEAADLRAAG